MVLPTFSLSINQYASRFIKYIDFNCSNRRARSFTDLSSRTASTL